MRKPILLILLLFCFAIHTFAQTKPQGPSGARLLKEDALTKSGMDHLYNLEYDQSIAEFTQVMEKNPDDPFAVNHVLQAVLLKELYRLNALDTTLYADNGFLTGKALAGDPKVKERIDELEERTIKLCDARIKMNPQDAECYYARGVARGSKLSYVAVVEKSFYSALRNALASRHDNEKCLAVDPNYTDAKLVIGMHNFIVGSLPMAVKVIVGVVGVTGNKKKGLDYLAEVANANDEASVDARVALGLFLRREGRYNEAYEVMKKVTERYPRNFLFALEVANALKDAGRGTEAIAAYEQIMVKSKAGQLTDPHIERAEYGLAESYNGQRKPREALEHYEAALQSPKVEPEVKIRVALGAAQMLDVMGQRSKALEHYRMVIRMDTDSSHASKAKKYISEPYHFPN